MHRLRPSPTLNRASRGSRPLPAHILSACAGSWPSTTPAPAPSTGNHSPSDLSLVPRLSPEPPPGFLRSPASGAGRLRCYQPVPSPSARGPVPESPAVCAGRAPLTTVRRDRASGTAGLGCPGTGCRSRPAAAPDPWAGAPGYQPRTWRQGYTGVSTRFRLTALRQVTDSVSRDRPILR